MNDAASVLGPAAPRPALDETTPLRIPGAYLRRLPVRVDERGQLIVAEAGAELPFEPRRLFTISGVPPGATRGGHSHRVERQFLLCVSGSCRVMLEHGGLRDEQTLDAPDLGLYVPPPVWRTMSDFSSGAVLLVVCSEPYRESDYIRSYEDFRRDADGR